MVDPHSSPHGYRRSKWSSCRGRSATFKVGWRSLSNGRSLDQSRWSSTSRGVSWGGSNIVCSLNVFLSRCSRHVPLEWTWQEAKLIFMYHLVGPETCWDRSGKKMEKEVWVSPLRLLPRPWTKHKNRQMDISYCFHFVRTVEGSLNSKGDLTRTAESGSCFAVFMLMMVFGLSCWMFCCCWMLWNVWNVY